MLKIIQKLSVAIATYNEETTLPDCLTSVAGWVDEIIVVDGGSIDQTVNIAKSFKAKIKITDNPPIFHINKQIAIDMSKNDWILQLDADERVTEELKHEIVNKINSSPKENGFWIPRKNYFLGKFLTKGGQYPDYTLRLYRKGKAHLPCKSVHEQAEVIGLIGYLQNPLIHLSDKTFERYLMRFNRYTSLFAEELKQSSVSLGFYSTMLYFIFYPLSWFLMTYIRHKGFYDGFPGFVFSFFSSLRFPVAYIKLWEKIHEHSN